MNLRKKILIVDDNEELCKNLSDILEYKGYEVTSVYDGYKAIEIFKKEKFEVVLLDVKMPGMNGVDTLRILKQIRSDILIIMITAFADDIFYREGLKNGEFKVIQKPIDVDKLLKILETTN